MKLSSKCTQTPSLSSLLCQPVSRCSSQGTATSQQMVLCCASSPSACASVLRICLVASSPRPFHVPDGCRAMCAMSSQKHFCERSQSSTRLRGQFSGYAHASTFPPCVCVLCVRSEPRSLPFLFAATAPGLYSSACARQPVLLRTMSLVRPSVHAPFWLKTVHRDCAS